MTVKTSLKKLGATKRKVAPNIYLISFDNITNMCMTLLRFAEHYESPKFRNKIFTLKEFKAWYRTTRDGKFTYYKDWAGYNIPSYVFVPFKQKKFHPLTIREKLFLNIIGNIKDPFYIIVATKGQKGTIRHELAHGLFYTNKKYKAQVLKILPQLNTKSVRKELLKVGYCKEVLQDEYNAFIVGGDEWMFDEERVMTKLNKLFDKYISEVRK